ncbi:MAG: hypothetical protein ACRDNF_03190, partial [Streptosporangiaceae bacterium]
VRGRAVSGEPVGEEPVGGRVGGGRPVGGEPVSDLDYDELARRLLVQVARQLAMPGRAGEPGVAQRLDEVAERGVVELEEELARVRSVHWVLSAENARLREQLRLAHERLAVAQQRAGQPVAEQLDAAEVGALERLLSPGAGQPEDTDAS